MIASSARNMKSNLGPAKSSAMLQTARYSFNTYANASNAKTQMLQMARYSFNTYANASNAKTQRLQMARYSFNTYANASTHCMHQWLTLRKCYI